MKFTYQYKTSDGTQHEGIYSAASRAAVYDELKKKGVKPFNVTLAPGFLNRLQSLGKRWLAIAILAIIATSATLFALRTRHAVLVASTEALPRHQIYGDPALMAEMERTGFATVFENLGERYLAHYAQPGVVILLDEKGTPRKAWLDGLRSCLDHDLHLDSDDTREVSELKRIVLWMKDELRAYLADGVGTPESYARRLNERLREEISIRTRIENELKSDRSPDALKKANESLRSLGLRPLLGQSPD